MNRTLIAGSVTIIVVVIFLTLGFRSRGNTIEKLNLKLNTNALEISGYKDDIKKLKETITKQNIQVDALKLNVEVSEKALREQKPKIIEKWKTITKTIYVTNSTCEQKLKESDEMDRRFFNERQNQKK